MQWFSILFFIIFFSLAGYSQEPELHFDHQAILVSELGSAADFYRDVLGLREIEDKTEQPHIRWFAMGNDKQLHIIETTAKAEVPPKGTHMAFSAQDLDAVIEHLNALDIYFENWMGEEHTTNTRPDGIRQLYLQDPDGYWIEINGQ